MFFREAPLKEKELRNSSWGGQSMGYAIYRKMVEI